MLTTKAIEALKSTGKQFEIADGKAAGLRLRVSQDGAKTFMVLYTHRGKKRRRRLGRYPDLSLADARAEAEAVVREAREGRDPIAKKVVDDAKTLKTVADLVEDFITRHVERHNKPSTVRGTSRILRKDIVEPWADRDVRDITRADVTALIEGIAEERSPFGASNVFRAGRTFFNWLVSRQVHRRITVPRAYRSRRHQEARAHPQRRRDRCDLAREREDRRTLGQHHPAVVPDRPPAWRGRRGGVARVRPRRMRLGDPGAADQGLAHVGQTDHDHDARRDRTP